MEADKPVRSRNWFINLIKYQLICFNSQLIFLLRKLFKYASSLNNTLFYKQRFFQLSPTVA